LRQVLSGYVRSGFSIIELLVAVAIISILIAITIPGLAAARSAARSTECLSMLRTAGSYFQLYANQNDSRLPVADVPRDGPLYVEDGARTPTGLVHPIAVAVDWSNVLAHSGIIRPTEEEQRGITCPDVLDDLRGAPPGERDWSSGRAYIYSLALATESRLWRTETGEPVTRDDIWSGVRAVRVSEVAHPSRKVALFERADFHGDRDRVDYPEVFGIPEATFANVLAIDGHAERSEIPDRPWLSIEFARSGQDSIVRAMPYHAQPGGFLAADLEE